MQSTSLRHPWYRPSLRFRPGDGASRGYACISMSAGFRSSAGEDKREFVITKLRERLLHEVMGSRESLQFSWIAPSCKICISPLLPWAPSPSDSQGDQVHLFCLGSCFLFGVAEGYLYGSNSSRRQEPASSHGGRCCFLESQGAR